MIRKNNPPLVPEVPILNKPGSSTVGAVALLVKAKILHSVSPFFALKEVIWCPTCSGLLLPAFQKLLPHLPKCVFTFLTGHFGRLKV